MKVQLAILGVLCLGASLASPQLSKPIAVDDQVDRTKNKFLQRAATGTAGDASDEIVLTGQCDANLVLLWMTEVGSSIYATPLIHDLNSDGQLDIIVPSFVHHLEVLDGSDGARDKSDSWPAYHKSTVHTSPLLYDFDKDNIKDILLATFDGEILIFQDTGEMESHTLIVPRLKVHKYWYRGLISDFIDHSNPDVGSGDANHANLDLQGEVTSPSPTTESSQSQQKPNTQNSQQKLDSLPIDHAQGQAVDNSIQGSQEGSGLVQGSGAAQTRRLLQHDRDPYAADALGGGQALSWDNFPLHTDGLGGVDDWHDSRAAAYGDYEQPIEWGGKDDAWGQESYFASPHLRKPDFVDIDSHIMCTPAIGDIDGDGHDELVVAASYFFDREYYDRPDRKLELGSDVDIAKYIAGGIVVFDLITRRIKWQQHLDLSTDHTQFRAFIYSSPTLVDLNTDGKLEIIVGTSMGFVYVLDHKGETLPGWPLQMGELQAQVAVAHLLKDNEIQIVAVDALGSVAVFDWKGKEIWERHLNTLLAQVPTFADVNGDGYLEVILGGSDGGIYVLSGLTGLDLPSFPFYTQGRILAPVLATRIREGSSLQLVVPSHDGHLYIVDATSGCADVVDIGETAYAMVLAEDLNHDGKLELVLSTMNGNVYAFEAPMKAQADLAWPAQVPSLGGFASKIDWFAVYASRASRQPRDIRGQKLSVQFTIRDPAFASMTTNYTVYIWLQGVAKHEMKAGDYPIIGEADEFSQPGTYTLQVPCPKSRATATVFIEVQNRWGVSVTDSFSLSFHLYFYRLLKWLLAGPFAVACLVVLAYNVEDMGLSLPSFQ